MPAGGWRDACIGAPGRAGMPGLPVMDGLSLEGAILPWAGPGDKVWRPHRRTAPTPALAPQLPAAVDNMHNLALRVAGGRLGRGGPAWPGRGQGAAKPQPQPDRPGQN